MWNRGCLRSDREAAMHSDFCGRASPGPCRPPTHGELNSECISLNRDTVRDPCGDHQLPRDVWLFGDHEDGRNRCSYVQEAPEGVGKDLRRCAEELNPGSN